MSHFILITDSEIVELCFFVRRGSQLTARDPFFRKKKYFSRFSEIVLFSQFSQRVIRKSGKNIYFFWQERSRAAHCYALGKSKDLLSRNSCQKIKWLMLDLRIKRIYPFVTSTSKDWRKIIFMAFLGFRCAQIFLGVLFLLLFKLTRF